MGGVSVCLEVGGNLILKKPYLQQTVFKLWPIPASLTLILFLSFSQ